ncbi:adhesin biosynthesis transcription regulatory family protein [Hafnia paralvei]|uniref:adhesin biosynthesis transcription regulatory family protein n=1 Tax=Hafnia paralvei TaxID=546367 RepID=UPI001CCF7AFA|nr:adhesin biosynthesis transcription regulatory family protein [Hafnia paralvei]UBM39790.1 adhesin biosynthesis transcription regulatory family protein [Hafnia paralvei]
MKECFLYDKYHLYSGKVSEQHFMSLIEVSGIRSDKVIKALSEYFVGGLSRTVVCDKHSVSQCYLSVKIKHMQHVSKMVYDLQPYYSRAS